MRLLTILASFALLSLHADSYQIVYNEAALPILTPSLEGRVTEKLILSNGVRVYLISDPGIDQSAAAVAVEVGSWNDPKEYPGTAHFLEHMLFMGTKAYPNENEYFQFIQDRGGAVNAFTASDRTVYMLSVNNDAFEEALDRFSHFFIDPLLSTNCINRELNAVDQEHAKNIEHDGWREWMVLKETANPSHPFHGFSTGNAKTLSGIPSSVLKAWYEKQYGAEKMHLVLLSPLPIEEMRSCAISRFSAVPKSQGASEQVTSSLFSEKQKGHMLFIKPVKDLKMVSLVWEVSAPFVRDNDRQVASLVAYALSRDDKGSLSQLLKTEKIAEGVDIGCSRLSAQTLLFSIDIVLTEQGLKQVDTVISHVFEALARLKQDGYPAHLFNETQTMAKLGYQYQSRDDAFATIQRLASAMPDEDLLTFPEKTHIPTQYDPVFIHAFLSALKPQECVYVVIADPAKTQIATDHKETWCQAEYAVKPVSKSRMTAWSGISPNPQIVLPEANPYLPENLTLVQQEGVLRPLLIDSSAGSCVYYASDNRYKVPQAAFFFEFKSPLVQRDAHSKVLVDLYTRALHEKLSPTLTLASVAGIACEFSPTDQGVLLTVQGYNDKAPLLIEALFDQLPHLAISKEEFEIYRTSLSASYDNASKELPVKLAMQKLNTILFHNPSAQDKLAAIRGISYEQFTQFCRGLFEKVYTEGLMYGNISSDYARVLWNGLKNKLGSAPFPRKDHASRKIFVLDEPPCKVAELTDRQGSGALLVLQEGPFTFPSRASQQVLGFALREAFFDTLRTKQQTGYIAKAWDAEEERQLLQFFAVQSSTRASQDLLARFDLFIEEFDRDLENRISEGRFESIRSNLITLLKMPPENMSGMAAQLDMLAFDYADFEWIDKKIAALQALSYQSFCEDAHRFLSYQSKRIAVLMQGVLSQDTPLYYRTVSADEIRSCGSFQAVR
ncbi:MAG: hypothetical protein RLZZ453_658 [Chlamydiota bacterium]|jgi:insulysin